MSKISELPSIANPTGFELIPLVDPADNTTKRAALGALVAGAPSLRPDVPGYLDYSHDPAGDVYAYTDNAGERFLANNPHGMSVQALLRRSGAMPVHMPADFLPLSRPVFANARYLMSGTPRDLRPNPASTSITAYVFKWPPDPVTIDQVRRARGNIGSTAFTLDPITVDEGACPDFLRVHQVRDISPMRDLLTGTTWLAINSIQRSVNGYVGTHFALGRTKNGTDITMVGYVELPFPCMQVWSPEWFMTPWGQLGIIVSVNRRTQTFAGGDYLDSLWSYHLLLARDLETASFDYVGELEGTVFPRMTNGGVSMIDPSLYHLNHVWYALWKAEPAKDNNVLKANGVQVPYGTLGWAAAPDMLGPYNNGRPFQLKDGSFVQGEGAYLYELPAGQARRYRIGFDDYKGVYGGGMRYMDTDDFLTFPEGVNSLDGSTSSQIGSLGDFNRHSTFVVGL